jgi:hypothetical protein
MSLRFITNFMYTVHEKIVRREIYMQVECGKFYMTHSLHQRNINKQNHPLNTAHACHLYCTSSSSVTGGREAIL